MKKDMEEDKKGVDGERDLGPFLISILVPMCLSACLGLAAG